MLKLFWFLVPIEGVSFDVQAWWRASSTWPAPKGVNRWLRSQGFARQSSLLKPSGAARGAVIALEEFWIDTESSGTVRSSLLNPHTGLASLIPHAVDVQASLLVLTDEELVIGGPRKVGAGRTVIAPYVRKSGQSRSDSQRHWNTVHAELVRRHGGITHYTQCPVIDEESGVDGIAIIHFTDERTETAFLANSANLAEQFADSRKFIDHDASRRYYFENTQFEQFSGTSTTAHGMA